MRDEVFIRMPVAGDGNRMHALAEKCPPLDLNSEYCYLLMSTHFAKTSTVAERHGELIGFQTGYFKPEDPHVLFIWQIAVGPGGRGEGLGKKMIQSLLNRFDSGRIRYLEQTVTKSNAPSRGLFGSVAKSLLTEIEESPLFGARDFASPSHEPEYLLRIGPITGHPENNQKNKI